MKRIIFSILLLLTPLISNAGGAVNEFTGSASMSDAVAGISIVNLSSGEIVESYNASLPMVPASVQKLLVTATALKCYAPEKTFETVTSYCGEINGNTLEGDLYVTGCGDPTLGSAYGRQQRNAVLAGMTAALKAKGIKQISGRIIADDSGFSYQGVSPAWLAEDMGNYYAAGSYGINFFDNMYSLNLKTGREGTKPVITGCNPEIPGINFANYLTVSGDGKDSAYICGVPFSGYRILSGRVPRNKECYTIKGDIPDPAMFFAGALKNYLLKNGIEMEAEPVTARVMSLNGENGCNELKALYTHQSDKLSDIITVINHNSNNLYAETLLRWVAQARGKEASADEGINAEKEIWREAGTDLSGTRLYDGSGMSPKNRISAGKLSEILTAAAKDKTLYYTFYSTLPQTAKDGTVRNFMKGYPTAHKFRLKSGSMEGVQCYAGYYRGKEEYAVVVMVNNFTAKRSEVQTEIAELLHKILKDR